MDKKWKIEAHSKTCKSLEKGNLFYSVKPFLIKNMLLIQAPVGEFSFLPSIIHFSSTLSLLQSQRIQEWLEYFHAMNLPYDIHFYDAKLKKTFFIEEDTEIKQFLEILGFELENSLKM